MALKLINIITEDLEDESVRVERYSDEDYDWFEEVFPLGLNRERLKSLSDLYTIHYGDKGKCIIKINGDKAHSNVIAVRPLERRKGVAKSLGEERERFCKSKGVKLITLNIREDNIASINLNKSLGFQQNEKVTDRFYNDGTKKLAFYKNI